MKFLRLSALKAKAVRGIVDEPYKQIHKRPEKGGRYDARKVAPFEGANVEISACT